MSRALITGGGNVTGGGVVTNLYNNPIQAAEFVNRELHMQLKQQQETSLVEAMKTPDEWLKKRHEAWNPIEDKVAVVFTTKLKEFYDAGYSYNEAQAKALKYADNILQMEMEELDLKMPGSSTIFQSAYADKEHRERKLGLAFGEGEIDTDTAIYKKVKAQRKAAKKQAKRDAHY